MKPGRPRRRNDTKIINLASLGFSYRQIATELGLGTATVHRSLREHKIKNTLPIGDSRDIMET